MTAGLFQKMCSMMAKSMGMLYHQHYDYPYLLKIYERHVSLQRENAVPDFKTFCMLLIEGRVEEDDLVVHNRRCSE